MPLALAAASPRRSGCRLSSRLRSWKAKLKSWMLNIRVLCTGIRGERRQAGRRASPASAGAALVSTSSLDTTTPSVVGGGECAGSVAGRGPVGSGPGGQAARGAFAGFSGEIRKFRGPCSPPGALYYSVLLLGFTRMVPSPPPTSLAPPPSPDERMHMQERSPHGHAVIHESP